MLSNPSSNTTPLGEGYGTEYERFALNKFAARMGCEVTVSHPSQEFLDTARKVLSHTRTRRAQSAAAIIIATDKL